MKVVGFLFLCSVVLVAACQKNTVSKIPRITMIGIMPQDTFFTNKDTAYIQFKFVDGDADIGVDNTKSAVYLKDLRFDTAVFTKNDFPEIDESIQDPLKGLQGTIFLLPYMEQQPVCRQDSVHKYGDTIVYELYITDRAGNESNHIVTRPLFIKP